MGLMLLTVLQEKTKAWQQSFGQKLGVKVEELTGDVDGAEGVSLNDADVICTTPEKFGKAVSRRLMDACGPCMHAAARKPTESSLMLRRLHHAAQEGPGRGALPGRGSGPAAGLKPEDEGNEQFAACKHE
jgi:hypothetical protein